MTAYFSLEAILIREEWIFEFLNPQKVVQSFMLRLTTLSPRSYVYQLTGKIAIGNCDVSLRATISSDLELQGQLGRPSISSSDTAHRERRSSGLASNPETRTG
ncbi:hypothetical protein A0H81_03329 [Grifola frondosa]|uniref:Uncharacterized protein n=1 Tax=Grifola frondosa TaxID=5627 RepID=A0A1C7MIQ2_GRIFR|nr:hypothetical protein A0H81_03329 [Grifola frondosa]